LVHLEADIAPRWQRRLAVVGGQDPAENLRLSRLENVTVQHIRDEIGTAKSPAALSWAYDVQTAADVVLCRAALLEQSLPPDWQADIARGAQASLPFSAADLMPHLQGPALGEALRDLTARWLASDLRLTKAQLLV
jgi:poly(A) polymerase